LIKIKKIRKWEIKMKKRLILTILSALLFLSCKKEEAAAPAAAVPITGMTISTFAGTAGSFGSADGTGIAASFYFPNGITVDSSGNLFVTDSGNNTVRKITAAGVVTTFAGTAGLSGSTDATGAAARFNNPKGIAADSSGNVFVVDSGNHTIRKITAAGVVTTFAGSAGLTGSTNATGTLARFLLPSRITADASGNLYVTDSGNQTIRKITAAAVVTTLAGTAGVVGSVDGLGAAASFNNPKGITVDGSLNVYVSDSGNHTIRKITITGAVTTLAGTAGSLGSSDGVGPAARFNNPNAIAMDTSGNVAVVDVGNHIIRKITTAGVVTTIIGSAGNIGSTDGIGTSASLSSPNGIAINSSGHAFVTDTGNYIIRKIRP
jgi:sugar lactone lactonase YvrE